MDSIQKGYLSQRAKITRRLTSVRYRPLPERAIRRHVIKSEFLQVIDSMLLITWIILIVGFALLIY